MANNHKKKIEHFMSGLRKRNPGESEFHQAVEEVASILVPFIEENTEFKDQQILERLTEPDRIISFRVCWEDDKGNIRTNRGFRVQFSNAIGPYKGGLRFHPTVNLSVLKFLAFEQIFKNSLTTLPIGAAKGGSNFNPKGKSDREIMRFCQSFMVELSKYIGPEKDVPAGDIGVGAREIGYLFGYYKALAASFSGAITGKGIDFGGSLIRTEATGYGVIYFAQEMLAQHKDSIANKVCLVSGSGNVAQYAAEKLIELGAKVVTMSDSSGTIYQPEGITTEGLEFIKELKNVRRGRVSEYTKRFSGEFIEGKRPWSIKCDAAFPCATQNEVDLDDAKQLLDNGCFVLAEGANMPTTNDAVNLFRDNGILYAPGKASNAGGVAISALEMSQNAINMQWSREEVDKELKIIMKKIHSKCVKYGTIESNKVDYVKGANIGGFVKVANTMLHYGII